VVVTRDKDLMQLIEAEDLYWDFGKAPPKTQRQVERDLEIGCQQMADFLALTGDSSDNIAGVPGVGAKTAKQLLLHFPDIHAILDHLDQLQDLPIRGAGKLADKIDRHREQLLLARQLTSIVTDIDAAPKLEQIAWQGINLDAFDLFCEEMGFAGKFYDRAKQLKARQVSPSW
jgi:5'-3' exonuclease